MLTLSDVSVCLCVYVYVRACMRVREFVCVRACAVWIFALTVVEEISTRPDILHHLDRALPD